MVSTGPLSATGEIIAFTLEPSLRLASAIATLRRRASDRRSYSVYYGF
jgi:hypothetical protein